MTTIGALTQSVWDLLYGMPGMERPVEDVLNGAITSGATSMTPTNITGLWKRDNYAEFATDGEIVRLAADASGAVTIRRAQLGTTAAAHSSGDVMLKNPEFPRYRVAAAINEVVTNDLWPHVWSWHTDSLAASSTNTMYALDSKVEEVVLVYQENIEGEENWHPIPNGWWDVERKITTVANENMLRLRKVWDYDETVYYVAKLRPSTGTTPLAAMDDELAALIPYGAASKLLLGRSSGSKKDPSRTRTDNDGGFLRDYRSFLSEFLRLRDAYARTLTLEVEVEPRFRRRFRRRW